MLWISTDLLSGVERMERGPRARTVAADNPAEGATVSTILIGVDNSERSEDATAFGRRIAEATGADILVANAYPYSDVPSRAANATYRAILRDDALEIAKRHAAPLGKDAWYVVAANPSPAHALHKIAEAEDAALVIVGSTHTGRAGRVLPGSTAERLVHGSPCAVAVVPKDYRTLAKTPIKRIGVAYTSSDEGKAAAFAAAELARTLGATLEIIGVVAAETFGTPALMGGPSVYTLRADIETHVQEGLNEIAGQLPVTVSVLRLTGDPAEELAARSEQLDILVMGSRGYGPLHSVLVGGVSGRVVRSAFCPVIVVPRGVEAPLGRLFDTSATTTA
jgi:nucleotide-binding universal stress UspA family protein